MMALKLLGVRRRRLSGAGLAIVTCVGHRSVSGSGLQIAQRGADAGRVGGNGTPRRWERQSTPGRAPGDDPGMGLGDGKW